MNKHAKIMQMAYRCPGCGIATVAFPRALTDSSDMLRVKCECGESALDMQKTEDGKIKLSVPCVYCKDNHVYLLSSDILKREEPTSLGCPFSNMNIFFLNDKDEISHDLEKSAEELSFVLKSLDAEELKDIQPTDVDEDDCPPDPAIYDTLNFVVRDLEAEGKISCPCGDTTPNLRFCDEGMQVYCERCGATHTFYAKSAGSAEAYLTLDAITLS